MAGRPTLLDDPVTREAVLDGYREGWPQRAIAMSAGIGLSTLQAYMADCRREDASDDRRAFLDTVNEARREGMKKRFPQVFVLIEEGGAPGVKAYELWARMHGLVSGPGGPSVAVDFDDEGRVSRVSASGGEDLSDLTDDEITARWAMREGGE
jgi:hypothetical protein